MQKIRKISVELFISIALSLLCFLMFIAIFNFFENLNINIDIGGCKSNIFIGILFGLPLGSISGIFIVEKFIYKVKKYNIISLVLSYILSFLIAYFSIFLLDIFGGKAIIFLPIIVSSFSILIFNIITLLIGRN